MDKNAIKKYAVWARTELIARVTQKALQYGIEKDKIVDAAADSVHGKVLSAAEKKQRQALIAQIRAKGFEQVMEEVAYTWFNRFSALRFMEVNGYLPSHVRVFTDEENNFKPQIITEAIHLELDGLDMEKVYAFKDADKTEELFKYLLIVQCNALNDVLPGMFQKIEDYTELLLPDNLLREGSVVEQLVTTIPEEDWKDQVQIIGWLYQYYNIEPKAKVFSKPKTQKITKEEIPAATQLFTPDWIVRYMVENSVGRLWLDSHPDEELKKSWHYYSEDAEQELDVSTQLSKFRAKYKGITPEEIKCIDPCMGSGHILAYIFDVMMQIYDSYGYTARESVRCIIEKNLWGLDIDERASQLAYFSIMMKARKHDRRFFSHVVQPHVFSICESNNIDPACVDYFVNGNCELRNAIQSIIKDMKDATEYGSVLKVTEVDFSALHQRTDEINEDISIYAYSVQKELVPLINVAEALAQKYDVVCTNPPYMGSKQGMNDTLKKYLLKEYESSKSDLYGVFMDVAYRMCKSGRYVSMINQHGWMFLSSFSRLRASVVKNQAIFNMIHLGTHAFEEIGGEVVQTTAFTICKAPVDYTGKYYRLTDYGDAKQKEEKYLAAIQDNSEDVYTFPMRYFTYLPDNLIGYWISTKIIDIFNKEKCLAEIAKPRQGLSTSDNDRFLKLWFEPDIHNIGFGFETREEAAESGLKWFPYNKGGEYRKWYGNNNYVINWQYDGRELRAWADYLNTHGTSMGRLVSQEFYYKKGLTWSGVGATRFGVRCYPAGMLFDVGANGLFVDEQLYHYLAGFLNTKLANEMIKVLNPTINTGSGTVGKLPIIIDDSYIDEITELVKENVSIAKQVWDSNETSWDFMRHPMIVGEGSVSDAVGKWKKKCESWFAQMKQNEERINEIFLEIYDLQDVMTPEVSDNDVSVNIISEREAICSLISYSVGCMFGRFSLDVDGLAYAGGEWDEQKYLTFPADKDSIIPICDDEYFDDDVVGRFVNFIQTAFGKTHLQENLAYIAKVLGGAGNPKEVIRQYFLNNFFVDHCSTYSITGSGKRPIYWQFDSGKKNGFKCLIYMHRYQPDTIARIRTDYVHEQQARYRTAIADLEQRISNASAGERVKLSKKLKTLQEQATEIHGYEEKIHHLADQMIRIDLDDGVKKNYEIFKDVLAKIK